MSTQRKKINEFFNSSFNFLIDIPRSEMINHSVLNKEAFISKHGALAVITPPESTGRSPKDTYIVNHKEITDKIDWNSSNNIPLKPETFDMILEDSIVRLKQKNKVYITNRVIGADSKYALPVKTITDKSLAALFTDNMFRPIPKDINKSAFYDEEFLLIALPYDKLDRTRYEGKLRKLPNNETSNMAVVMDYKNKIGIVFGSAYLGSIKKLMFTVMNYLLPEIGILPLHASANEDKNGNLALFLGLSGTGKTTLSTDSERALLGDDEHGWSNDGVANFENGCYAKLVKLDKDKEPEIYNAIMHEDDYLNHGSIVENAIIYPDGSFDFFDTRLTENSRGSYPLYFLSNTKESSKGNHPSTIIFLTADANGVLPPVAKLNPDMAMLWFLMGYTSKLAGTETGIVDPVSTFSRFFGEPFMPQNPDVYAKMLGEKIEKHKTKVFLVNTGWSGGPYGIGKRFDLNITRKIVKRIIETGLEGIKFEEDKLFHILIPKSCPYIDKKTLKPDLNWDNKKEFKRRAEKLAKEFSNHFDKVYGDKNLPEEIIKNCPGK